MIDFATMEIFEYWIGNVPNLDHARLDIDDTRFAPLLALGLCMQHGRHAARLRST